MVEGPGGGGAAARGKVIVATGVMGGKWAGRKIGWEKIPEVGTGRRVCKGAIHSPRVAFRWTSLQHFAPFTGTTAAMTISTATACGTRSSCSSVFQSPHSPRVGRRKCQSVARSCSRAARSNFASSNGAASSCRPIGSPPFANPHGTLTPGMPARLALMV